MQLPVICPQCQNEFQLTDVMYSQILSRVRGEGSYDGAIQVANGKGDPVVASFRIAAE